MVITNFVLGSVNTENNLRELRFFYILSSKIINETFPMIHHGVKLLSSKGVLEW